MTMHCCFVKTAAIHAEYLLFFLHSWRLPSAFAQVLNTAVGMYWQILTSEKVSRSFQNGQQFHRYTLMENLLVAVTSLWACMRVVSWKRCSWTRRHRDPSSDAVHSPATYTCCTEQYCRLNDTCMLTLSRHILYNDNNLTGDSDLRALVTLERPVWSQPTGCIQSLYCALYSSGWCFVSCINQLLTKTAC